MKFSSHLARVLFSAMLCVGAATPAAALEIKAFSAPSQKVQVGEAFPVRLRVDTGWLSPSECSVVLMPDGLSGSDLAHQPKLRWNTMEDWWQLNETYRVNVRAQSGEVKDGLMEFTWIFNTPGRHSLRIDQELSACKFDGEWSLEFQVLDTEWSALDAYFLAPVGKDVGRNLSGQTQLNDRWRNAEFAVAEKDLKSLKEAIESFGPKKWDEWQSQVLQPTLRPLGVQNPRLDTQEDRYYEPLKWVSEDRRFREGEGLLALGRDRQWVQQAIASGKWVLLAQIDMGAITSQWKAQRLQAEKAAEDSRKLTQRLAQALPDAKGQYTALRVNAPKDAPKDRTDPGKVCAKSDSTQSGLMVTAYRWSKPFVAWSASKQAKGFGEVRRTLNELYEDLKSGSCGYVVVDTEDALAFVRALQRDQIGFELLDFKTAESLFPDFQEAYGYKSAESARLALTFAADSIPDAAHADTWVKHGVITRADYDKAQSRMTTSGYAANSRYDSLSQFLEDEQAARKDGGTAVAVKKKREAKEAAQAAADRERDLRSYPYRAELTCNNGPYGTLPVYTCLTSSNANSSVSLRNCGNWSNLDYDRLAGNVASIELCPSFEIKAQNTSEFVLTLVVKDKRSGKVLSHQTATRFRYVAIRN